MRGSDTLHASLVARHRPFGWQGVLIFGPSGSGKSDLALRMCARGFRLVADDRVCVWPSSGRLYGAAPERLKGLIEVRHVGIIACTGLDLARIALAVTDCGETLPERLPEPGVRTLEGVSVPALDLRLREPATPERLIAALDHLRAGPV
ncbi:MAG: HPr kinase/phosphorylase [Brevundimonas sp.]|jgi:serine kinase of HPr protein (carbohydrate metabolism regulator)|uniref:HPr kinase/phosphorylase n=1 Tax=Brevundimonas sp. TaxID=1871086 RepID=UPI00391C8589